MKKIFLFIGVLFLIFSCASNKRKCRLHPFQELDSLQQANKVIDYDMLLPKKWEIERFSGGDWYYIKGEYIDSLGYHTTDADVYISSNDVKSNCNGLVSLDKYLEYYIQEKERTYIVNFKYLLLTSNHKKYDKVYILKYNNIVKNLEISNLAFLFFHNNTGYTIEYKANKNNFDKYFPDVEKMVNSFSLE